MKPLIKAINGRPLMAVIALIGACCGPAINLTVEEWKDNVDKNDATTWQSELVIDAWSSGLRTLALAVFAYYNRNPPKDSAVAGAGGDDEKDEKEKEEA